MWPSLALPTACVAYSLLYLLLNLVLMVSMRQLLAGVRVCDTFIIEQLTRKSHGHQVWHHTPYQLCSARAQAVYVYHIGVVQLISFITHLAGAGQDLRAMQPLHGRYTAGAGAVYCSATVPSGLAVAGSSAATTPGQGAASSMAKTAITASGEAEAEAC